jgi:hypothetical protein
LIKPRKNAAAFGQADPTDGRAALDWKTRYADPVAQHEIRLEAIYLAVLLLAVPILMLVIWIGYPKALLRISDPMYEPVRKYGLAWLGGTLGGILFSLKWLYHSVARGFWNLDRRLWRFFTPHISGGLAFAVVALVASGGIRVFDSRATASHSLVVGTGFLVGYFSDSAIAKLNDIAETLFGTIRSKEKHTDQTETPEPNNPPDSAQPSQ